MPQRKLILLELNEVPFRVLDEFCATHPRSCLARLLPQCQQYETLAEDSGHLSPWVTWPTLHRGVVNDRHSISCLGQDLTEVNREFPTIWSLLAEHGISTGVFGSLHSHASWSQSSSCAFHVPDVFAGSECYPDQLAVFQRFNQAMVRDSARNVGKKVPWQAALRLLAKAPALGLKVETLLDVGGQLLAERFRPARRVRRRTYQTVLAFDVFLRQLKITRPAFATFFTNHVASAMHRYWAARFPGDYPPQEFGLGRDWVTTYQDEIDFAMTRLDRCLARLLSFIQQRPEYALWVATSMGQAATTARPIGTQLYLMEVPRFMAALGVPPGDWSRRGAMAPDVNLIVAPQFVARFRAAVERLVIDGKPLVYQEKPGGFFSLRFGHQDLGREQGGARMAGRLISVEELGLANVVIEEGSGTTAYHIPQGMLLIYEPNQVSQAGRVQISTLDIAPAILRHFGVPVPPYMQPPWRLAAA